MDRLGLMLVRRYKKLLPAKDLTSEVRGQLSKLSSHFRLVCYSKDLMRSVFLYQLLQQPMTSIEVLSVYDLIDIYLEKDSRYKRLLDITPPVLLLYAGYEEFANKRLEEAVIQVIENQKVHRNQVWLFYKGTLSNLETRYPVLSKYMKESAMFEALDLNKGSQSKEVDEF